MKISDQKKRIQTHKSGNHRVSAGVRIRSGVRAGYDVGYNPQMVHGPRASGLFGGSGASTF